MDPELPKTLTFAADAAKKVHDLIALMEEEFAKLKSALQNAATLMGHAHVAVLAQPSGIDIPKPMQAAEIETDPEVIAKRNAEIQQAQAHLVFPNPNLHETK